MKEERYTCDRCGKKMECQPSLWGTDYHGGITTSYHMKIEARKSSCFGIPSYDQTMGEAHICLECVLSFLLDKLS